MMDRRMAQALDHWLTTPPEDYELPETCPICDEPNCGEDGEWLSKGSEPFCSMAHHVMWLAEQYKYEAEVDRLLAEEEAGLYNEG